MIRESQRRRYANVDLVDQVIALDRAWVGSTPSPRFGFCWSDLTCRVALFQSSLSWKRHKRKLISLANKSVNLKRSADVSGCSARSRTWLQASRDFARLCLLFSRSFFDAYLFGPCLSVVLWLPFFFHLPPAAFPAFFDFFVFRGCSQVPSSGNEIIFSVVSTPAVPT